MLVSHSLRSSVRRWSTYVLASSKFAKTRLPLIRLHGRHAATRFVGSFSPLRARGNTKSTDMVNEFSKLAMPSNPQYWQRYLSRSKIFSPSSPVKGLARRPIPRKPKFAGIDTSIRKLVRDYYAPEWCSEEAS